MVKQGEMARAEEILHTALKYNPYSQQLNYALGELLLKRGEVNKATPFLEQALKVDYQDQYQHDVSQHAVWATLAQAYEAMDKFDEADRLYKSIVAEFPRVNPSLFEYANNRISALSLVRTKPNTADEPSPEEIQKFVEMLQQIAEGSGEAISDGKLDESQ